MEFMQRTRGRKSRVACSYPCALQLYKLPPTEVVSLQEFEELAEKRLRLLQAVESKRVKLAHDGVHRNNEEYETYMKPVVKGADTIPLGVGIEAGPIIVLLGLVRSGE
jgi:hypothetical protein